MMEQRRDAHRGSAGLSLTWQGLISRVRLLSRYMSVYRRLLTLGMRPLQAATAAKQPPPPPPRRKSAEEAVLPAATASGVLRGSLESTMSLREDSLLLAAGVTGGESTSDDGVGANGRRNGDEQWTANWVGGSSAEIRKLAEQIRTRFGRGALVRKRYSTGTRRELEASRMDGSFLANDVFSSAVARVTEPMRHAHGR